MLTAPVTLNPVPGSSPLTQQLGIGIGDLEHCADSLTFAFEEASLRHASLTAIHAWHTPQADISRAGGAFTAPGAHTVEVEAAISGRPVVFPGARLLTVALTVIGVGGACYLLAGNDSTPVLILVVCAALAFGVTMVMPIGGADMPVVVALLNSFTGIAVAIAGFVIDNGALIIGGALVGASGGILTLLMAKAMNRSILSVMIGGFGTGDGGAATGPAAVGACVGVRSVSAADAAIQLAYASKVVIVPGYGLAAAQASTRRPSWPRCWPSTPGCSSPSTRWPGGCPVT